MAIDGDGIVVVFVIVCCFKVRLCELRRVNRERENLIKYIIGENLFHNFRLTEVLYLTIN